MIGLKLLANLAYVPLEYFFGPDFSWLSATASIVAGRMADQTISLESTVQRRPDEGHAEAETANVILITYATTEEAVRRAIAAIEAEGVVASLPQVIRIEKD